MNGKSSILTAWIARFSTAAALAAAILSASGCGGKTAAAPAPAAPPPPLVAVVLALARNVPIYIDQIGKCISPEIVTIRAQASGPITKIGFLEGADVSAGKALFTIDPAPYQAALDQALAQLEIDKAALEQAQALLLQYHAQVEQSKADLAQNETRQSLNVIEYNRAKVLAGVIAQTDYDARKMAEEAGEAQVRSNQAAVVRAETQIKQGAAAIKMAQAKVKSSEAAVEQARINLGYTEIVSPIDGRAGLRFAEIGNVVNPADPTTQTLVTIQRMDPVYAEFSIAERELARVRASMAAGTLKAECGIPERADARRDGEVCFIDNSVQDGTGTIKLRARIKNADRMFWPGQFLKVRLVLETRQNAVLVPSEAMQLGQAGPFVFAVKADSTVDLKLVKPGLRYDEGVVKLDENETKRFSKLGVRLDDWVALDEGVKAGDTIVLKGQLMLQPGIPVTVQKEEVDEAKDAAAAPKDEKKEEKKEEKK